MSFEKFVCLLTLIALNQSLAISSDDGFPTPGLYQVDTEADQTYNQGMKGTVTVHNKSDGASGDESATWKGTGHAPVEKKFKGSKPITTCVPPRSASSNPPMIGNSCTSEPGKKVNNSWVMKSNCSFADITTTITKINDKTWEYVNAVKQKGSQFMAAAQHDNTAFLKSMLENAAKNGTAEEKAMAKKQLAEFPAMEAQMKKQRAQMAAMKPQMEKMMEQAKKNGMPGAEDTVKETVSKSTWTRIADTCPQK